MSTKNELKEFNYPRPRQKIIIRKNGTTRVTMETIGPSKTDQSYKKQCDINNIISHYQKTGLFPNFKTPEPRFIDNTEVLPLEEAFEVVNRAYDLFYELPSDIRKLMDNDPSKLEGFLNDPENKDLLIKKGLLSQPEAEPSKELKPQKVDEPKAQKTKTKSDEVKSE
jgi:phage internal scaffolding protein